MKKDTRHSENRLHKIQTSKLGTPGIFYKAAHGGDEASATWCEVKYLDGDSDGDKD